MSNYALLVAADGSRQCLFQHLVSSQALRSVLVPDGLAALAAIRTQGQPALILTELELPKLDGLKFLEALRQQKVSTPAIAVSAFREMRDAALKRRDELGLSAVLSPSVTIDSLVRAVRKLIFPGAPELLVPAPEVPAPAAYHSAARLAAMQASGLVDDAPPDQRLQALCAEVARNYGVETALISLVLRDRQWFKAYSGLSGKLLADRGTPIEQSFCRHAVDANAPLIVNDAKDHPMFHDNALVTQGLVRGYAGVPLQTSAGTVVGTLCVIDSRPLPLDAQQLEQLRLVGRRVAAELELRINRKDRTARLQKLAEGIVPVGASGTASARSTAIGPALEVLEGVVSSLDAGVLVMTCDDRRILYANSKLGELAGIPAGEIVGMTRSQWIEHCRTLFDDPADFMAKLKVLPEGPYLAREELVVQRPLARNIRWTAKPLQVNGQTVQIGIYEDVTARRAWERAQVELALTDELTGIRNRRSVVLELTREMARAGRDHSTFAVCLFDVDHFKKLNDTHGHAVGDQVLRFVAQVLSKSSRGGDCVGRWGGEEFIVCFLGVNKDTGRMLADRLREEIRAGREGLPSVTISGGVAEWAKGEVMESVIQRADDALYRAKEAGRNRIL